MIVHNWPNAINHDQKILKIWKLFKIFLGKIEIYVSFDFGFRLGRSKNIYIYITRPDHDQHYFLGLQTFMSYLRLCRNLEAEIIFWLQNQTKVKIHVALKFFQLVEVMSKFRRDGNILTSDSDSGTQNTYNCKCSLWAYYISQI